MKFFAYRNICRDALEVVLVDERTSKRGVARPVEFVFDVVDEGELVEPTMLIPAGAAESLMQALWDAGLRPNNGAGSSAEADALKRHIAFAEQMARTAMEKVKT